MSPDAPRRLLDHLEQRFYGKVIKTDSCWLWRGARLHNGYGSFSVGGRTFRAHRVAWELARGRVPDDLRVLHRCDNPACVNPDHLWLGTQAENMVDRDRKGRGPVGPRNGRWKGERASDAAKKARVSVVLAVCAALLLPATAFGIPIHRHMEKTIVKEGRIPVRTIAWTEVVNVAPPDADQDGVRDGADDCPQDAGSLDNGCDPEPATDSTATSSAPFYGSTSGSAPSGTAGSVAACESGGDPATNTGNGYYGAYQFDDQTWAAASGQSGHASDYSMEEQTAAFENWYPSHPTAWPVCGG